MAKHIQYTETSSGSMDFVLDEDTLASNSATKLPTQQSVKAYVDTLDGQTVPVDGAIPMREPAMDLLYDDLANDVQTNPVDIVTLGDSITVLGEWPSYMAEQLATRFNVNSGTTYSVQGQSGFRHAYPGGAFGSMNGTIQGVNVRGAHIGPGDLGAYDPDIFGLVVPAIASNYASTPDAAALDITGDISGFYDATLTDWTPPSSVRTLVSKWGSAGQRSYKLQIVNATGILRLVTSADGTASTVTANSTVAPGFTDSTRGYVKWSMDVNNGSGNYEVKFYKSTDNITYTQLGSTVTGSATTIFNSTAPLEIGSEAGGATGQVESKVHRASVWSGLHDPITATGGTLVFDANFTALSTLGQTSFTESSSNAATVTVTSSPGTVAYLRTLATNGSLLSSGQSADCTYTCSGMYIIFGGGGGTLTVKDGGSGGSTVATIDTSLYSGDNNLYWVDLTTYASHNVWIGCTVGDTILDGICTTAGNNARGVLVWRIGQPGITTQSYNYYPGHGLNLISRLKTLRSGRDPHVFVCTGYNDGVSTYSLRLGAMLDDVEAATNGSIAVWGPWGRSGEDAQARSKILRTLKATHNMAIVDSGQVVGGVGAYSDYSELSGDNVHPNGNGNLVLAMQWTALATGDPIGSTMDVLWNKYNDRAMTVASLTSTGAISGTTGTFSGAVSGTTGTFPSGVIGNVAGAVDLNLTTNGRMQIANAFGYTALLAYNVSTDANSQFFIATSQVMNTFFGLNAPAIGGGAGGASGLDIFLSRVAAHTWGIGTGATTANRATLGGTLKGPVAQVGNVGTGTDDLMSHSIPAGTLGTNYESIHFIHGGNYANTANAKTLASTFGATTLVSVALPTNEAGSWRIEGDIVRTGAATQITNVVLTYGATTATQIIATPAASETLANAIILKCTANATADNDITQNVRDIKYSTVQ